MSRTTRMKQMFLNPEMCFRALPFWAWNDRLETDELVRQAGEMQQKGMGGFFMHSRDGLETPFLGEAWMQCIRETVRYAETQGMEAWLYDEDRWPSGSGGGQVPASHPDFRAKGLTLESTSEFPKTMEDILGIYRAVYTEGRLHSVKLVQEPGTGLEAGGKWLVLRMETAAADEWFNHQAPPDNLNPESVAAFIAACYEPYREVAGPDFGKTVQGIFTDEPSVHDRHCRYTAGRGWVPWTRGFEDYFQTQRGYSCIPLLPYLFFEGDPAPGIRHDFWRTLTERFLSAYTMQISRWCRENHLKMTGHFLWEGRLGIAARVNGAVMPHYYHMDVPGIDLLCEQISETLTVRQCTSVANQFGKPQVLTETYGCTGWDFTFEGQKWLGDWQYVMGVNRRCQHLALYSLKGCRKRDYPPVFNCNTTWWEYARVTEDYFARLGAVLSEGTVIRPVLVVHPASSAWAALKTNPSGFSDRNMDGNIPEINRSGEALNQFLNQLMGQHVDFDLGDEMLMEQHASVSDSGFSVGIRQYDLVVLPPVTTLFRQTADLLKQWMDRGGRVISAGHFPEMTEGRRDPELRHLKDHPRMILCDSFTGALEAVVQHVRRNVRIRDASGTECSHVFCMHRKTDGGQILFMVNTDRHKEVLLTVSLNEQGDVEQWDPLTGQISRMGVWQNREGMHCQLTLGPAGSALFVVREDKEPLRVQPPLPEPPEFLTSPPVSAVLGPVARFTRTMPNVLTLDHCRYSLEGKLWSRQLPVWQAQEQVRQALGMRSVKGNGLEQRYRWTGNPHPQDGAMLALLFTAEVRTVPEEPVYLAVEGAEDFSISLNGALVHASPEGWYIDRSIQKVRLPELRQGTNELILRCSFREAMELEDCYLLGDFGVSLQREVIAEPELLRFGDWGQQGYLHYPGSMVYHFSLVRSPGDVSRAVLQLGEYAAVTAEIRVNGRHAFHAPWKAAATGDITGFLSEGINRIDIEVMGSPRNCFGPLHLARGKVPFSEWTVFRTEGAEYSGVDVTVPYGLLSPVVIWKKM